MDPLWILAIGMAVVLGGILVLRLHAFLALVVGGLIVGFLTTPAMLENYAANKDDLTPAETETLVNQPVGERLATEFGNACIEVGILIAMASIIGITLLESGAAEKIVRSLLQRLGDKNASAAFLGSGFALATPVFFDTVFYLMIPIGKAMTVRSGRNYALYILSIVAGATMAHSLVPPTPGPLFVAGELNVDVGMMMLGGIVVGIFSVISGYGYALWFNRRWQIALRDTADISVAELKAYTQKKNEDLPPFWLSILPIALPVVLIAGNTILSQLLANADTGSTLYSGLLWARQLGEPNLALTLSAFIGLAIFLWHLRPDQQRMAQVAQKALSSAGQIILITAAGGAFGGLLQQTGIGPRIQELAAGYQMALIPLAFAVTTLVRTAQGSATVAMITAVGILSGFGEGGGLAYHPLYLALAIGCGSKPIMWMNDSGFWVICKMSGMTEWETLKSVSVMLIIMSLAGVIVVMLLAWLFPLI